MIKSSYLINSALYVIMVFVAGLVWDKHVAVLLSITTAGFAVCGADQYLCKNNVYGQILIIVSWILAVWAFIFLVMP